MIEKDAFYPSNKVRIDYSPSYPDEVIGDQSKSPRNLSCLEMFLDDFTPGQLM